MTEDTVLDKPASAERIAPHRAQATASSMRTSATSGSTTTPDTAEGKKQPLLNPTDKLNERQELIRIISNRLFLALFALLGIVIAGGYLTWSGHILSAGATIWMILLCGIIGGFISLQRRLNSLQKEDLLLLGCSWVYILLSPLIGGILGLLLYFLFISGLLQGDLFPNFVSGSNAYTDALAVNATDTTNTSRAGLTTLFAVTGDSYKDYAKLVFWCFVAGYSEGFVTNIISNFESKADKASVNAH